MDYSSTLLMTSSNFLMTSSIFLTISSTLLMTSSNFLTISSTLLMTSSDLLAIIVGSCLLIRALVPIDTWLRAYCYVVS